MSDLEFLSISEAARLMGVCENTLRDWDIEGKFKAIRTIGGHRRYSLTMIRDYLNKNEKFVVTSDIISSAEVAIGGLEKLLEKWISYLTDIEKDSDKKILACLLQNVLDCSSPLDRRESAGFGFRGFRVPNIFSTNQKLWLTAESWKRSKLKKLVSVQVISGGPCSMIYWTKKEENVLSIDSDAVAAKSRKLDFSYFPDANFDGVKDSYANAISMAIDVEIFQKLAKLRSFNIENFIDDVDMLHWLNPPYDYIVGPSQMLEILSTRKSCENIDLIPMPTLLDTETLLPISLAGKYPENNLEIPIFSPYVLVWSAPCLCSGVSSALIRYGWFEGDNMRKKIPPS